MTSFIHRRASSIVRRLLGLMALGLYASACGAVRLDPDGTGQVLIYPYYTTRGGNQTILSVTNHTDRHKALQVVINEARNGRNVLNFNLYLAPRDSWSATIFALDGHTEAGITAGDDSCLYPDLDVYTLPGGRGYAELLRTNFIGTHDDAGPNDRDRLREGIVKIFELGTLVPGTEPALAIEPTGSGGRPLNCRNLRDGWLTTYWKQNPATHMTNPTGGLSGEAMVLNVAEGTVMSYAAAALADFRTDPADIPAGSRATVVNHSPPILEAVDLDDAINDPLTRIAEAQIDLPNRRQKLQYPVDRAIDAVSAVLAADAINVTYVSDDSVGATTDWVLTFPTRAFYTDEAIVGTEPVKPFTSIYPRANNNESRAAMPVPYQLYDRTGRLMTAVPGYPALADLRYTTQVLALAPSIDLGISTDRPLGSALLVALKPVDTGTRREGGWINLDLLRYQSGATTASRDMRAADDGTVMLGLPVLGFSVVNYVNTAAAPGMLANYSMASPQRRSQDCRRNTVSCK
jgi:hypothetical protein